MRYLTFGLLAMLVCGAYSAAPTLQQVQKELHDFESSIKETMAGLSRQVMLQQLFVEERIRSDGDSGVKQIRVNDGGVLDYQRTTFTGGSTAAIHEHSNYDRTVGMGELNAVLNGVEFRTRHNDYKLYRPSTKNSNWNAVEEIPFPDVPPSVLAKKTVQEQMDEMTQYFKAFHSQDTKVRNYVPYFKPVMCYLEGSWTTDTKDIQEPFESDRHFLDAKNWFDLQEKIRYMAATGGKNQFENFSFLPTTIVNVTVDGRPVYAQWNYRIVCHPIQTRVDLRDIELVDDLAPRLASRRNMTQYSQTRRARFRLAASHGIRYNVDSESGTVPHNGYRYGLLDKIMMEIPGKENYNGYLNDNSFGMTKYRIDTKNLTKINTARYHRWYKVTRPGAMGLLIRRRGFSDDSLFVAQTNNPKIPKMEVKECTYDRTQRKNVCHYYDMRTSYAIPLELVWLTPLSSWNPYNLEFRSRKDRGIVTANGRNGGLTKAKAYNGTTYDKFYFTPNEFYHGGTIQRDPADTARDAVGVLDRHGEVRRVSAAGIRIFLPDISGVGKIRQRYPLFPIHQEGSVAWKNLQALQDMVMDMKTNAKYFEVAPEIQGANGHAPDSVFVTSETHMDPPGMHKHQLYITAEEMHAILHTGTTVSVFTTQNNGHQHDLQLKHEPGHNDRLKIVSCDGRPTCWDHHSGYVYITTH